MTDKYESQQLFNFLTDHQDTVTLSTAQSLINEFQADFSVEDVA